MFFVRRLSQNTGREVAIQIFSYQRVKKGDCVVRLSFHSEADRRLSTIEVLQENVNFVTIQDRKGVIHIALPNLRHTDQYLAYDSHHPQSVKRGIVKCLYNRSKQLITPPSVISQERKHLSSVFFLTVIRFRL